MGTASFSAQRRAPAHLESNVGCGAASGRAPRSLTPPVFHVSCCVHPCYSWHPVFSNGELDPWSTGGVTTTLSDSLPAIIIKQAGHHMDLFFSNPADTDDVIQARLFEVKTIQQWLTIPAGRGK